MYNAHQLDKQHTLHTLPMSLPKVNQQKTKTVD